MAAGDETQLRVEAPSGSDSGTTAPGGSRSAADPAATRARAPDTDPGATRAQPHGHAAQPIGPPAVAGYELTREIAQGGMGAVYAAVDRAFGREVAVKVTLPGASVAEFVREAAITARLAHPGVPPVYAMGELADGRPFLAMKLIRGDTLDRLLKARTDPAADRPRLLAAFEAICQAVGYAHAQGIVHRDLKPANVMVGAFGEVQVMDWGLAKGIGDQESEAAGGVGRVAPRGRGWPDTAVETAAGAVKGTPAYMAPEQARGEPVDARADVFALGGILAAILTGKPPFGGNSVMDTVARASRADLGDTFARLEACGANADLLALARRCLAARAAERPADGAELAAAVAAYRAGVEGQLRRAERDRAAAEARAAEERNTRREAEARGREQRKRRRVQAALAAALVLLAGAGGGFAWWQDRQAAGRRLADERAAAEQLRLDGARQAAEARADAEAGFKGRQARQGIDANLALAADLRKQYKFKEAEAALAQALKLASGGAPGRAAEVEQARRDLAFVARLDDIRYRKWAWVAGEGGKGDFNTGGAPADYRRAFAAYGLGVETLDPAAAAARIAASGVRADAVAALDDWALYEPDTALGDRLLEVSRRADPDPWRDRLRSPAVRADRAGVAELAARVDTGTTPAAALSTLAALMRHHRLDPAPVLAAARTRHPTDFELAFALGQWHTSNSKGGQQVGPYEAALALRPGHVIVWNNLGVALEAQGDRAGAAAAYREAIRLEPGYVMSHYNLGTALKRAGDLAGAVAAHREAIRLDPKLVGAHYNLGIALAAQGDRAGAAAAYREAIRLDPELALAHSNLGVVLVDQGDLAGAVAAYREAIRLEPKYAPTHSNLGIALAAQGNAAGAAAAHREAIRLDPGFALAHSNLGVVLAARGDLAGAAAAYREAIRLEPSNAMAHTNLAAVYVQQKKYPEAMAAARAALASNRDYAGAHAMLGLSLHLTGDIPGARAAYAEALRLDPKKWGPLIPKLPPVDVAPPPRMVPAHGS